MASARPDSGSKTNVQRYSARFTLMSEAGAPAGAKGKARIDSRNVDGTSTAGLSLQTFGLETGTYNVSAIIPDGPVALG
ncbi:MAG TPA: hypothetical protein VK327_18240, partial [Candidatus Paceibacterota bacterium]|nr:hypothetical protein [Candidatus Paceibacterota bacterium]